MALRECSLQFRNDPEPCPIKEFQTFLNRSMKTIGTKKDALFQAFAFGAMFYTYSKPCWENRTPTECYCNLWNATHFTGYSGVTYDRKDQAYVWTWGNCKLNVLEGIGKIQSYTPPFYSQASSLDAFKIMTEHNKDVVIGFTRDLKVRRCRCHGISMDCSLKVCYEGVRPFSRLGRMLKKAYKDAKYLEFNEMSDKSLQEIRHKYSSSLIFVNPVDANRVK